MLRIILVILLGNTVACGVIKEACYPTDLHCEVLFGRHDDTPNENRAEIERLLTQVNSLLGIISDLSAQAVANESQITVLEAMLYDVQADLTEIELRSHVTEFIDPCGNGPGFDEIILKMSTGELVAYFESGGTRFLTILTQGSYQTTDSQKCDFVVTSTGEIQ